MKPAPGNVAGVGSTVIKGTAHVADAVVGNTVGRVAGLVGSKLLGELPEEARTGSFQDEVAQKKKRKYGILRRIRRFGRGPPVEETTTAALASEEAIARLASKEATTAPVVASEEATTAAVLVSEDSTSAILATEEAVLTSEESTADAHVSEEATADHLEAGADVLSSVDGMDTVLDVDERLRTALNSDGTLPLSSARDRLDGSISAVQLDGEAVA